MTCTPTATGFRCEKDKPIIIVAGDSNIDTHAWVIDGITQTESGSSIQRTYNTEGTHTFLHSGSKTCGTSCGPEIKTLEIAAVPTPTPTPAAPAASNAMIVGLGFVAVLAVAAIVMSGKK